MTSPNPITTAWLSVYPDFIILTVWRNDKQQAYHCYQSETKRDRSTRFHRMVKIFTETLKTTYLANTGRLAPNKW